MPVRDHLLQIQRDLYDRFRSSARRSVGDLSPGLRRYFLEYQKEFTDYKGISSRDELVQSIHTADILVCGDYHTLPEAQRAALHLVKEVLPGLRAADRPLILALEMLTPRDNLNATRFLAGEMDEKTFLRSIHFEKNWGFSWQNYRPLFEYARQHGISIVGLNCPGRGKKASLGERDRFAATVLTELSRQHPQSVVFALIGDLHLASAHLPAKLEAQFQSHSLRRQVVIVHQNRERLFWKLAARGLEHRVTVLRLKENNFCVMNTPPWVKLQSYLQWLEGGLEKGRAREGWDSGDYEEDFLELAKTIQGFIGAGDVLSDAFEIFWLKQGKPPRSKKRGSLARFQTLVARRLGSYFIPTTKQVILSTPHINAAATQAALYLHATLSGRVREFEFPRQDFYSAVWFEAIGFFGSKVINPHRRCYGPGDFSDASRRDPLASRVAQHLAAEKKYQQGGAFVGISLPPRPVLPERSLFYYRVARCLGQILGGSLYAAVAANHVSTEELQILFRNPFSSGRKAREDYLRWIQRLDSNGLREAIRRDPA